MDRIAPLALADRATALQLHGVLQRAYAQEAQRLGLRDFPPLARSVFDLQASPACHLGAWVDGRIVGGLAFAADGDEPGQWLIESLVVDPPYQRRGWASRLLAAALSRRPQAVFAVATAAANAPALALYRGFGFEGWRRGTIGPQALPLLKLRRLPAA